LVLLQGGLKSSFNSVSSHLAGQLSWFRQRHKWANIHLKAQLLELLTFEISSPVALLIHKPCSNFILSSRVLLFLSSLSYLCVKLHRIYNSRLVDWQLSMRLHFSEILKWTSIYISRTLTISEVWPKLDMAAFETAVFFFLLKYGELSIISLNRKKNQVQPHHHTTPH